MGSGLPVVALAVVLGSALLHATWNVLLSRAPRGLDASAVALLLGLVAWTPIALARWRVEPAVWPYVLASAALEVAYFAALNLAYAKAPAHAAYPVARGLAPALLLPVAVLTGGGLAGSGLAIVALLGVLVICTGVLLTARGEADRRSVLYAVPVALCIAGYTLIDAHGVRYADPASYLWLTMVPVVIGLLASRLVVGRGTAELRAQLRGSTIVVGFGVFAAYGLTLVALAMVSVAQVPAIAALRESSILFVLALSWLTAHQRPRPTTALGAALVFAGVVVLALG